MAAVQDSQRSGVSELLNMRHIDPRTPVTLVDVVIGDGQAGSPKTPEAGPTPSPKVPEGKDRVKTPEGKQRIKAPEGKQRVKTPEGKERWIGSTLYLTYTSSFKTSTTSSTPSLPSTSSSLASPELDTTSSATTSSAISAPSAILNTTSAALFPSSTASDLLSSASTSSPLTSAVLSSIMTTTMATSALLETTSDTLIPTAQPVPPPTEMTPGREQQTAPEPTPSDDTSRITAQNVNRNAAIGIASGAFAGVAFLVMGAVIMYKMRKRGRPGSSGGEAQ